MARKRRAPTKESTNPTKRLCNVHPQRQQLYQDNSTNSPLLSLPGELRNAIYEEVLGGQFIHIVSGTVMRLVSNGRGRQPTEKSIPIPRFVRCGSDLTEEEVYQDVTEKKDLTVRLLDRHNSCSSYCATERALFHLDFLRTCRQIYNEASLVPFTANTFSFQTGRELKLLKRVLGAKQFKSLRALHFRLSLVYNVHSWVPLADFEPFPLFPGLRNLYLNIIIGGSPGVHVAMEKHYATSQSFQGVISSLTDSLAHSPLSKALVTVEPYLRLKENDPQAVATWSKFLSNLLIVKKREEQKNCKSEEPKSEKKEDEEEKDCKIEELKSESKKDGDKNCKIEGAEAKIT